MGGKQPVMPNFPAGGHQRQAPCASACFSDKTLSIAVVKQMKIWSSDLRSHHLQIFSAALASLGINLDFIRKLLPFSQTGQPGALNSTYMDEDIVAAIVRLNKAETFLAVEPLHGACCHPALPFQSAV
jgi:hypothetical protein